MWDQVVEGDKIVQRGPTEIYYSILSIHKFFKGSKKIFCVGDNPKIRGVIHIPHKNITKVSHPKAADSIAKLKIIANHPAINEDFVYMYDDIVLLKPCTEADLRVSRAIDLVISPGTYFTPGRGPSSKWKGFLMRTMTILKSQGFPTWNYETHLPRWFNKSRVTEIITKYGLEKADKNQMLFASLYFNNYEKEPGQVLVQKTNIKAGVYEPHQPKGLAKIVDGKLFLNYDNTGLNKHLKTYIKQILK